ncbi:hypothetical protein Q1695_011157 [Nippostrongylus brasiliensis]|nr:hypothetical protein Q1695_011157 [Nippostrongylus brasiliensis]
MWLKYLRNPERTRKMHGMIRFRQRVSLVSCANSISEHENGMCAGRRRCPRRASESAVDGIPGNAEEKLGCRAREHDAELVIVVQRRLWTTRGLRGDEAHFSTAASFFSAAENIPTQGGWSD